FPCAVERDPEVVEVIGPGPRKPDRFAKTRHRGGVLALQREAVSEVVVGIVPTWPAPDSLLEHGDRLVVASQVVEGRAGLDPVARVRGLGRPRPLRMDQRASVVIAILMVTREKLVPVGPPIGRDFRPRPDKRLEPADSRS